MGADVTKRLWESPWLLERDAGLGSPIAQGAGAVRKQLTVCPRSSGRGKAALRGSCRPERGPLVLRFLGLGHMDSLVGSSHQPQASASAPASDASRTSSCRQETRVLPPPLPPLEDVPSDQIRALRTNEPHFL